MNELLQVTKKFLSFRILDPQTPLVEVHFNEGPEDEQDAASVVSEAEEFMRTAFPGGRAYFLNCYDNVRIPRRMIEALKRAFLSFNAKYSLGDVRYGGTLSSKAFWISTAVQEKTTSRVFSTREEAMDALQRMMDEREEKS